MEEIVEKSRELSKKIMGSDFAHGYPHVERVLAYAKEIAGSLPGVNLPLLQVSVYLHDVGRRIGEPHAYYSARFAEAILREWGLDENSISIVVNAIEYHSFSYARSRGIKPAGTEAMVLSDADKLDALGIVGFLRVFQFGFENGRSVYESLKHFDEKIFELKKLLHFEVSKRIADKLEYRTRVAVEWLREELSGEKI